VPDAVPALCRADPRRAFGRGPRAGAARGRCVHAGQAQAGGRVPRLTAVRAGIQQSVSISRPNELDAYPSTGQNAGSTPPGRRAAQMRLIQLKDDAGQLRVGVVDADGAQVRLLDGVDSMYALAGVAIATGRSLADEATAAPGDTRLDYAPLLQQGRVLAPLHHSDPAHCLVTGTGLTHLGSAAARDAMHQTLQQQADEGTLTDSMRMFQWGVEGGIPESGEPGAQPEWFYKGDGAILAAPGQP